ncbi:hypothetical protein OIU76_010849 [Salix suchowensis]|nr:hypothetical protein OIU76_010849 [Salix suchowensis]
MANSTFDLLGQVQAAHQFDHDSLFHYASAHVPGFPSSAASTFTVKQFGHGQSNPTFLLEVGNGGSMKRYVLRKKPPGKLLQSAHAVDREYQVLRALGERTEIPVPRVFCLCRDASVIGTDFYIMEFLEGRIFIDPKLPGLAPERREAIYRETARVLAALHSVDVDAIGLGKYGRRNNYCKRQVERWTKQYIASTGDSRYPSNPKMLELAHWLQQHIPSEDSSGEGIVHGDFRIDNVVFHPIEDRVIGILDWELSTLGNQMTDVAYSCLAYIVDINHENQQVGKGFELTRIPEGIPSQAEYLAEYCSASGKPWPAAVWKFHISLAMFRGAAIYAGDIQSLAYGQCFRRKAVLPNHPPDPIARDYTKQFGGGNESGRFVPSEKVLKLRNRLVKFMENHIYPMENEFYKLAQSSSRWTVHPEEESLKELAKKEGFLIVLKELKKLLFDESNRMDTNGEHDQFLGAGLSNLEYGYLCEIMGRSVWAPQVFNCGAPDTGNMEVLLRYGNKEQLLQWLVPLLQGKIRSGFAMTEPQVASSDATNIECSIKREGDSYIINGRKWWTSGAMDPRCKVLIVMGKTDFTAANHKQQSMILVDIQTPGNILLGEGRGFEIAQGRLGPGRLHHCMRLIGASERGMQMMVQRALSRRAFGKLIAEQGSFRSDIAKCRIELEKTRLLVLEAADQLDRLGNKKARGTIAMAKVAAPNMALMVLDKAMQVHGAAGVSSDTILAHLWATARTLRIADGPDEVHLGTIAKLELQRAKL